MSATINEAGIALTVILLVAILPVVALAFLVRLLNSILSKPGDWAGAIVEGVGVLIRHTFAVISIVVALGITWSYWKDAQLRANCYPSERNSERSLHGSYWARYCYFGHTIVLRLYDDGGERLIAERTYRDTSGVPVKLHWGKEALMYREEGDLGEISLPPTFLDQMLARLP
ncbi:hypothetical protein [Burkholderia sp. LMG 32019]|uniref:hypothetical protein n=1 Tax=Burkholderia sp. LMG 32019 TaxID=3158173 RepID=UPI003C3070AB